MIKELNFMWTKTKSLLLSRILAYAVTGVFFILTFFVPSLAAWYEDISVGHGLIGEGSILGDSGFLGSAGLAGPMCVCLYVCELLAFAALWALHVLLENINKEKVFIEGNTKCLRVISWACMLAGVSFAVFGLWRFIFFLPAFFAVMFGLIMRVLKNVFEKAVEIKSENDFTI